MARVDPELQLEVGQLVKRMKAQPKSFQAVSEPLTTLELRTLSWMIDEVEPLRANYSVEPGVVEFDQRVKIAKRAMAKMRRINRALKGG